MPRVEIALNGRNYLVGCEAGQEQRLKDIAAYVDGRLRRAASGIVGASEAQLLVLSNLLLADEVFDLKAEVAALKAGVPGSAAAPAPAAIDEEAGDEMAALVDRLARRIEDIAARLERP